VRLALLEGLDLCLQVVEELLVVLQFFTRLLLRILEAPELCLLLALLYT